MGSSGAIDRIREMIARLSHSVASVIITGESGTGKELVARNLHRYSPRHDGPFLAINCAALHPGILESELFGHGRGSFTGAVHEHAGFFEQAHLGTLFLDEVGEMPPATQAKLLRVLQDGEVRRLGSPTVREVDVRVVSATNVDIESRIRAGEFRIDLFYRLNIVEIDLPPLRDRPCDTVDIINHLFTNRGLSLPVLPDDTLQALLRYHWPGNVRELENELERLFALHGRLGVIEASMLSDRILCGRPWGTPDTRLLYEVPLPQAVSYLEEIRLRKTLEQNNWNKSRSARKLGLSRQGLLKKIRRYGITENQAEAVE